MKRIGLISLTVLLSLNCQAQNLQWVSAFSGFNTQWGKSIALDHNNNIYTAGVYHETTDFNPDSIAVNALISNGKFDVYISKLDESGNYIWARSVGGPEQDQNTGIAIDNNNNIIISGTFADTVDFDPSSNNFVLNSSGNDDVFILKLDSSGNFLWVKVIGSSGYEKCNSITLDDADNIYLSGSFMGTIDFDPGPGTFNLTSAGSSDGYVTKLNSSGDFIWAYRVGGTSYDEISSIKQCNGWLNIIGKFLGVTDLDPQAGVFNLSASGLYVDIFCCKWDTSGTFNWAAAFLGKSEMCSNYFEVDQNNNLYITGHYIDTVDFDPGPAILNLYAEYDNVFIAKLDPGGNLAWVKSIETFQTLCYHPVVADANGNVYVAGLYDGIVDIDPGPGTFNLSGISGPGNRDIFFLKLDSMGDFVWANSIVGTNFLYVANITLDTIGNLFSTGGFTDITDFGPGINTYILTSVSNYDAYVYKQGPLNTGINELELNEQVVVYPNPVTGNSVTLTLQNAIFSKGRCQFTDLSGRVVYESMLPDNTSEIQLTLPSLSPGIYFISLQNGYARHVAILVVE